MAVRPSISLSYEGTSEEARRLLRRLALLDQPVFSGWLGAALLDQPFEEAENLFDELVSSQLIDTAASISGEYSQYRCHDLIRAFARERLAAEDPPAEQRAALERALGALLYLCEEARRTYFGGDDLQIAIDARRSPLPRQLTEKLVSDPLSWYETERTALVAGVRQAARAGLTETCWGLTFSAIPFFQARNYLDDWREANDIALAATRKEHHVRGEAAMLACIAELHLTRKQFGPARRAAEAAARLFGEADDERGEAMAIRYIADMDRLTGRLDDAIRRYAQALSMFRAAGDRLGAGYVLQNMASAELDRGQRDAARELLSEALALSRLTGHKRFEAQVLYRLGEAALLAGELDDAAEAFRSALLLVRDIGDLVGEAYALRGTGVTQVRQGELGPAREALRHAIDLAVVTGDPLIQAQALRGLGEAALAGGDPGQAIMYAEQAAGLSRSISAALEERRALTLLDDAQAAHGEAQT